MKQNKLAEIIHKISFAGKSRTEVFMELRPEKRALTLVHLTKHIQHQLILTLKDDVLIEIFSYLDPDEITDLIQLLPDRRQEEIIKEFSEELKKTVEILNQFDPQSAAGLMNLDYILAEMDEKIADIIKRFKIHEKRTGRLPVILAMEEGRLKGHLPGHKLGFAKPSERVKKYIQKIHTIKHNASHDEVLHVFRNHPHNKIAVLGHRGGVVGVIYSDDILKVLREEETSALYDFAGVHNEENVMDSARQKVKYRYKWLIINLATAFFASFTVGLFDEVIAKYVLLAVYMPIVAGMGGNAGTQTLAILVRGIALNQIDLKTVMPTLKREILAGIVNGLINGLLVAAVVIIVNRDYKIAFILCMAMIFNLFVAAFFGTLIPLIMKKFGKDPATSATIFITTATDVLGFMAFLGLATLILS